ncbi:MAG TPA: class I SAM-dependent methyltransferase [Streptosporangiaceae bacterium]|nr:class I SAM-dependent methyltransferase [Streptosporangiaceae bacterium]
MTGPSAAGAARARRYDAWFESPWGRYAWRIEAGAVLAALGPLPGRRVADIGCGTGRLLAILTSHGAKAAGVDADAAALTLAAARGTVARADAHRLPLADASMDAAVTVATLEFTTDPGQVLTEMARVTRPGGRLVAAVLNPASLWGLLDRPAHRDPYTSGCFLPRADLLALGRRHGRARIRGVLFAAGHLPARPALGPALETAGKVIPRFGACQILTVRTGQLPQPARRSG